MKAKRIIDCLFITALCLGILSCATTQLVAVWKDQAYQQKPRKIMVIGFSKKVAVRNVFEDGFVRELKARGTDAVASYTLIPPGKLDDSDFVNRMMKQSGADVILSTRLADRKTVQSYVPGQAYVVPGPYRSWGRYYRTVYTPGYYVEDEYAYAETNLYDVATDNLIWTGRSETLLNGSGRELIDSFIKTIIESLAKENII